MSQPKHELWWIFLLQFVKEKECPFTPLIDVHPSLVYVSYFIFFLPVIWHIKFWEIYREFSHLKLDTSYGKNNCNAWQKQIMGDYIIASRENKQLAAKG